MKHAHNPFFIAAALWVSPLVLWYLGMLLIKLGVDDRSLDVLVLPSLFVGGVLDLADAPSFLVSSNHGLSPLSKLGELLVFGFPTCALVVMGWRFRSKANHPKEEA